MPQTEAMIDDEARATLEAIADDASGVSVPRVMQAIARALLAIIRRLEEGGR